MSQTAFLLLLAVAASQVDLYMSKNIVTIGQQDITACPITYYGETYNSIHMLTEDTKTMILCFANAASGIVMNDCIYVREKSDVLNITATVQSQTLSPGSPLHQALTNIQSTSSCFVQVDFPLSEAGNSMSFKFYNFGGQAAGSLFIKDAHGTVTVDAQVKNTTVFSWTFTNSQLSQTSHMDISGCRVKDDAFAADTRQFHASSCANINCSASAVLTTVSTCGIMEVCNENNRCVGAPGVCTVTGSTIIDFYEKVHSVPDRCLYTLTKPRGRSVFGLMAGFLERRRKDVAFLDHLILSVSSAGVKIYLEQGGKVRVDDQPLTLSSTAQVHHGVTLSKDETGVTVTIPFTGTDITVFFDGYTAQVKAQHRESLDGLCGNPSDSNQVTTLSAEKSATSPAGCNTQHVDTMDRTINCTGMTEHCNLLKQAPFTECHNLINPASYVTACTNTLCKYPAVDGLKCQFLDAYAKACSLIGSPIVGDWRSSARCSAVPRAFCPDQTCSTNEFCGEKYVGKTRCFCRSLFAAPYKSSDTLGEPTVCMQSSATVSMFACLLEDKGIDYTALHLNDQKCTADFDSETRMVTFSFDSTNTCGVEVMMNDTQIIYKNTITKRNHSMSVITRHDQVEIDFSCYYAKPDMKTVAFRIKDSSVVQEIVSGVWNYTLMMNAYTNPGRTNLIVSGTEISLDQKVWLELKTEGLDDKMVTIVTDSCWATNLPSPTASLKYDLIIKGCPNPNDPTVEVEGNGMGTSNYFSFNMFTFSGKSSEIYLHCKLELCLKQSNSCAPTCGRGGSRRRRSYRSNLADQKAAFISMAWTK